MAITLQTILATNSFSASRVIINNNFATPRDIRTSAIWTPRGAARVPIQNSKFEFII